MSPSGSEHIWENAVRRSGGREFTSSERGQRLCLGLWLQTAQLTGKKKKKAAIVEDSGTLCRFPPTTHIPSASPAVNCPTAARNTLQPNKARLDSHPSGWRLEVQRGFCFSCHSFVPLSFLRSVCPQCNARL